MPVDNLSCWNKNVLYMRSQIIKSNNFASNAVKQYIEAVTMKVYRHCLKDEPTFAFLGFSKLAFRALCLGETDQNRKASIKKACIPDVQNFQYAWSAKRTDPKMASGFSSIVSFSSISSCYTSWSSTMRYHSHDWVVLYSGIYGNNA